MSTPARIAERHDPLFKSCVAHITATDHDSASMSARLKLSSNEHFQKLIWLEAYKRYIERKYAKRPEMLARLKELALAQDRAALANAGVEGARAA